MEIQIKEIELKDKSSWVSLSREYDQYVEELQPGLNEWYEGSESSISFENYMNAKIKQTFG